jgi:arginyl-tRNA synthetase
MKRKIESILKKAVDELRKANSLKTIKTPEIKIEKPKRASFGDYSSNIAIILAKAEGASPSKLVQLLAKKVSEVDRGNMFVRADGVPAGFLNLTLSRKFLQKNLIEIIKSNEKFGRSVSPKRRKVLIEFVSANPTGPLHLGHGRWAVIGDAIASVLEKAGYMVDREYYINDVGRQVDLLKQSVIARSEGGDVPEGGYSGEYISLLAEKLNDKLGDKNLSKIIIENILAEQRDVLSRIGVKFDRWFYESSLYKQKRVEGVISSLSAKNATFKENGALWFKSKELGDDKNRVLVREDGIPTYFSSDIAYHEDKFRRRYDKIINVWGSDHHGYVARLKAAIEKLGYPPDKLEIIIGQLVSLFRAGAPVKMSKRAGEMITLSEVVDEIGSDATRFFFLMLSPDSHLDFDLELAKKRSTDNPVYYVQYAHARISSILREAEKTGVNLKRLNKEAVLDLLTESDELDLIKKLLGYPDEVVEAADSLLPHRMIAYSRELAAQFHNFYHKVRVITDDAELTKARLALIFATRIVLRNVLVLLGISAPEKM